MSAQHTLKVVQPYFDALIDGSKTFEVRRNDRAYQRGDVLRLREFDLTRCAMGDACRIEDCVAYGREVTQTVSFVYSGDPRFGGVESGFVVLALRAVVSG